MQFNLLREQFNTRHKVAESEKLQCCTWVALCRISELQSPTRYNVLRYVRNVVYYLCCSMQNLWRTYESPILSIISLPAKNLDPQHWNLKQLHSTCMTRGAVVTRSRSCWTLESAEICKSNTSILWPWHKLQVAELRYYGKSSKIVLYSLKFMFISKVHERLEENLKDQAALAACRIQKNLAQRFTWAANIYQTWTVQQIVYLKFYLRETQEAPQTINCRAAAT
jgi:hypothetical protein